MYEQLIRPGPQADGTEATMAPPTHTTTAQAALQGTGAIGADLDLTLIDTRAATAHALQAVNDRCEQAIDVAAFVARLGPPIRQELARWVPPHRIPRAVEVFRECFVEEGIDHLEPLPGALELVAAVAARGRRFVVVTSRVPRVAQAALTACGIEASAVVGGVTGVDKAPAISSHQVAVYLGDHELDMEAAQHAGVPGVGVATGSHPAEALLRAGAAWVVDDLTEAAELVGW
ncbi:HAD hydrolase-like protein [Streptomyces sp. NBC_01558]|uniref:HAD family hydrolase n=1 Tax=Streptomyces sp. NBC_01558 TaxID=2975878 RepID=UPI002DD93B03|nr:HAD hydrolase-like protein [Streptomyces sp. NBC_01558]WSD75796.1 HAD hydrolase-like protein [Streptomyces sp. NBC_01558]